MFCHRALCTILSTLGLACGLAASFPQQGYSQATGEDLLPKADWAQYAPVTLTADIDHLSANQKEMLVLLMEAAAEMDHCFWYQAVGNQSITLPRDVQAKRHYLTNYGPWDRLRDNRPFIRGAGARPPGANFYPIDMSKSEFEEAIRDDPEKAQQFKSLYTFVRRGDDGELLTVPYREQFEQRFTIAADKLRQAAGLAEDAQFKDYLLARADALLSDNYQPSDMLWMDMKNNPIDMVIGPIETYEDQLFGYKASCESYVLVKDMAWSERLSRYATLLPELQKGLPVDAEYKKEEPGTNSDLNAYDVIYYAGDCNAGSKTIAINLPNDEEVQLKKGTRRLQLKNAMQAKFDTVLVPLSELMIVDDQREHISFDAFFSNTMFHEVAHGLGIKYTITDGHRVREALQELASALEEGKADVLGLYMVNQLMQSGELESNRREEFYVTFMASIFRSVRFGSSSAHGKANILRFNFFKDHGAVTREESGKYRVHMDKMEAAMTELTRKILTIQGDGDYAGAQLFMDEMGSVGPTLQADLERVNRAGIPTDIVFQQGPQVLGLQ